MSKKDAARLAGDFLLRHGMHVDRIDREKELEKLLGEMEKVRRGGEGSVKMIPTYIGTFRAPEAPMEVTVIDIGGTNVRAARATILPDGEIRFGPVTSFLTPGVSSAVDTAGFYGEIARRCRGALGTGQTGICFSLATIPDRDRDAVMVAGGKQIRITDMLGKKVGESFRAAMAAEGLGSDEKITVINDTVAAALGGAAGAAGGGGPEIGFIYGTGTNICFREPSGEIVNVESGAYTGFPTGDIDALYDQGLIDTGQDTFEKMVSGGYQGGLMEKILETAVREDILPAQGYETLFAAGPITSKDISAFSLAPSGSGRIAAAFTRQEDRDFLEALFDLVTERSACLCAITITAAMCRAEVSAGAPARITAEGSTYLKQKDFAAKLQAQLDALAGEAHGLSWEIGTVENAVFRGIAASCLSS